MKKIILLSLVSTVAFAKPQYHLFSTARGLSMGQAMTAVADDYSSLYYNPAGLAQIPEWELRMFDWGNGRIVKDYDSFMKKIKGISGGNIATQLKDLDSQAIALGGEAMGFGFVRQNFGFMLNPISMNAHMRLRVPTALFAQMKAYFTSDSAVSIGFAHSWLDKKLRLGVVARPVMIRGGFDLSLENNDILALSTMKDPVNDLGDRFAGKQAIGLGWGYDGDVGMQGELTPLTFSNQVGVKPMMGFVVSNVLATTYPKSLSGGKLKNLSPPRQYRKASLGLALQGVGLGVFIPTLSFDVRDVGVPRSSYIELFSSGIDLTLKPRSWFQTSFRGHFYKGNLGGGVGMKLWKLDMEGGTYALNIGSGPGVGVKRLYYLSIATFI